MLTTFQMVGFEPSIIKSIINTLPVWHCLQLGLMVCAALVSAMESLIKAVWNFNLELGHSCGENMIDAQVQTKSNPAILEYDSS